jgi:hypothetical protein
MVVYSSDLPNVTWISSETSSDRRPHWIEGAHAGLSAGPDAFARHAGCFA